MWNERQRLIRNNQENAETWRKSTQAGQWKEKYKYETVIRKKENNIENSDKEKYKWKNVKNNEKTKCSPRGERGAVAKAKPQKLLVS